MEELRTGDYVTPSVRLLRPLAQGGMGTVWIAEHLVLETHVVVKLMTAEVAGNDEGAARFAREAAIAAAVKSPHVVQVFDSGVTDDGVAYIVMELLDGHDLATDLATHGRMAADEIAIVIAQLAKGLAKAHQAGIVHRDIKPENVFLCDGEPGEFFVKLLDFGTAKDEGRASFATIAGQVLGTPYYMSPEQLMGTDVDARADIWSLGVLAFEAVTGARPFEGATIGAITVAIHTTEPRMTDIVPDLPPALDAWFARACAREPAMRFESVRDASEAFTRAAKGDATWARASGDAYAAPSSRRVSHAGRAASRSERVATSLSSTLAPPRRGGRTSFVAAGVVAMSVLGMLAFFVYGQPLAAPRAPSSFVLAPPASSSSPVVQALPPPPPPTVAEVTPETTATASATATAAPLPFPFPRPTATSPPPPTASAAPRPTSTATPAEPLAPMPSVSASATASAPEADPEPPADLFRDRQ